MVNLGKELKIRGKSYTWLAEQIGLKQPAISTIIKAGSTSLANAIKIARLLDLSLDYLCGLDNDSRMTANYDAVTDKLIEIRKILELHK